MGYERKEITIIARISRHNSINDKLDDIRWEDFVERLKELASREEYKPIELDVI